MRWLKHLSTAYDDPKISAMLDAHGPAAYGVYWIILESVASQLNPEHKSPEICYSEVTWCNKTRTNRKNFRKFLEIFASFSLISVSESQGMITVVVPNLLKYRDEWSSRSRVTPESLPSPHSGKSRAEADKEQSSIDAGRAAAGLHVLPAAAEYPLTSQKIKSHYPATSDKQILETVAAARREKPNVTDSQIAECCKIAPHQNGPGLFKKTVVDALRNKDPASKPKPKSQYPMFGRDIPLPPA